MNEWVGESHTDLTYTNALGKKMLLHAVRSAVTKCYTEPMILGESRTYTIVTQALLTPGEANIPETIDVTATILEYPYEIEMTGISPEAAIPAPRKRWWRR